MSGPAGWTEPAEIKAQVDRLWADGRILSAALTGEPLFPLALRLRRPDAAALSQRFDAVRAWIRALEAGGKARQGFGYEIAWTEINHRQLGRNRVPTGITVPTELDALRLIGRTAQAARFRTLAEATVQVFPALADWLARRPLAALEQTEDWPRVLAVLSWFRDHPRSGFYLRQLDIPGVDTKFIETRKGLLTELLDRILPPDAIDPAAAGARNFEARYGLHAKPPLIRFRLLDDRLRPALAGLSDLSVPAAQFADLSLPVERVFVTENEINGLAFPAVPGGLVIFGLGYGLDRLAEIPWLGQRALHYWGDIDTHGYAILDRFRASFPQARSFLMDRETLITHAALWVVETDRHPGLLSRLTADEHAMYDLLRGDRLGDRVRLEQERISFRWLEQALRAV
jgi:hypothetical protein